MDIGPRACNHKKACITIVGFGELKNRGADSMLRLARINITAGIFQWLKVTLIPVVIRASVIRLFTNKARLGQCKDMVSIHEITKIRKL